MVRSKGATPGTKEFQQQAYQASKSVPLNESEISTLRDEQREIDNTIKEVSEPGGYRSIDVNKLKEKSNHIQREIERRTPVILKGNAKDKLIMEERNLADKLAIGIPTHYEMDRPAKNPGAVDKNLNWNKRNAANIQRWVEIQNAKVAMGEERTYIDSMRREK